MSAPDAGSGEPKSPKAAPPPLKPAEKAVSDDVQGAFEQSGPTHADEAKPEAERDAKRRSPDRPQR